MLFERQVEVMRNSRWLVFLATSLLVALVAGCASDSSTSSGRQEASVAQSYRTVDALAAASTAVVRVTQQPVDGEVVVGEQDGATHGVTFQIQPVRVDGLEAGDLPTDTGPLDIRLLKGTETLEAGDEYLVFVKPFHDDSGENGQYVLVGGQAAAFTRDGDGWVTTATDEPGSVTRISMADVERIKGVIGAAVDAPPGLATTTVTEVPG